MKSLTIFLTTFFVLGFVIACNGQPNTRTTFELGIVHPLSSKNYVLFGEVEQDTSTSRLIDGMDYLSPDVSDLVITLVNQRMVGDTLLGEFSIQDMTVKRYFKGGIVQSDKVTLKYSAMTTSYWFDIDTIEPKPAGFFVRRKN